MKAGRTTHHRDELHVLTGSYVLDAVEEPERSEFERHLRDCLPCTIEVHSFEAAVSRLAMAETQPPPADLKARIRLEAGNARPLRVRLLAWSQRCGMSNRKSR